MVILVLSIGIVLGVASVIFAMDNSTLVTVSFLSSQFDAPLAVVILASMSFGIFVTLLSMVPNAIKEEFERYALKRQKQDMQQKMQNQMRPAIVEGSQM